MVSLYCFSVVLHNKLGQDGKTKKKVHKNANSSMPHLSSNYRHTQVIYMTPPLPVCLSPGQYSVVTARKNISSASVNSGLLSLATHSHSNIEYNVSNLDCDHNCGYFPVYTNQRLSVLMM